LPSWTSGSLLTEGSVLHIYPFTWSVCREYVQLLWASALRYTTTTPVQPSEFPYCIEGHGVPSRTITNCMNTWNDKYIQPHSALRGNVNINVNRRQGSFLKLTRMGSCLFLSDDLISAQIYSFCLSLSSNYYTTANIFFFFFFSLLLWSSLLCSVYTVEFGHAILCFS